MKLAPTLALPTALSLLATAGCGTVVQIDGTGAGTTGSSTAAGGATTGTTSTGTTSTGTGGAGGGAPSDVTGTMIYRYFSEGSPPIDQPANLVGAQVQAFVWSGSAWTTYPGVGTANGSFTIPSVPAGLFMVDVAGAYLYTTAHTLDMGSEVGGRVDAIHGTGTSTVGGTVQNLDPWQQEDELQWVAPNASGTAYFTSETLAIGTTSLMGQMATWSGSLIDGSKGDVLYVTQIASQQAGNTGYGTLTRFASFPGIEQLNGVPVIASGSLTAVAPTEAVTIDFRATQFGGLGSQVGKGALGSDNGLLEVFTYPGATVAGNIGYTAALLDAYSTQGYDVSLGKIAYGNPFPPSWGEIVYAGASWNINYTAPGATSSSPQFAYVYVEMPPSMASAGPIVPGVTPPQQPLINGKSALDPLEGIGLTPVLSWSPPAIGTPTAYQVSLYAVTNAGGATDILWMTEIVTTTTSLPLPPNVLQTGTTYLFVITAVVSPIDASTKPFHGSITLASADVVTGLVTP